MKPAVHFDLDYDDAILDNTAPTFIDDYPEGVGGGDDGSGQEGHVPCLPINLKRLFQTLKHDKPVFIFSFSFCLENRLSFIKVCLVQPTLNTFNE